jgi:cellulose synthase/poly-beta-1,6-N-acetylglucosamine synthase-like glycosyltransferase
VIPLVIKIILLALQALVFAGLVYYYVLLLGGVRRSRRAAEAKEKRCFAILIPAHNEEAALQRTLAALKQQVYPQERWDAYVIADYCEDRTASVAREGGAFCFERATGPRGRKAYPLAWGVERLLCSDRVYDAFVVLDADSRLNPDFLALMNDALGEGHRVLQGRHVILNSEDSSFAGLAEVDMRLNNFLRNRAKRNLGLSARLMGDAMVFTADVLKVYGWPTESLGEDREYGLFLVEQGLRIHYVPEAVSQGQAAVRWGDAAKQRLRWYGGVFEIRREFGSRLFKAALTARNAPALDLAIELLLPSFSTLALLSVVALGLDLLLRWGGLSPFVPLWASTAGVVLWVAFPFLALLAEGAPPSAYRALIYAPAYLVWRAWVGLMVWLKRGRVEWVRTKRREETL